MQLHKYNFCDLGRMEKITPSKRRKIMTKAMLLELEPHDPSDNFIINYKDTNILEIYKKLTELKLDKINLYKQTHNQLTYPQTKHGENR